MNNRRLVLFSPQTSSNTNQDVFFSPVAFYRINGCTIINRLIVQAREAEITEIIIVLDYKKELFLDYIINNPSIITSTNHSIDSFILERGTTYICSYDLYFKSNPFLYENERKFSYTVDFGNEESFFYMYENGKKISGCYDARAFADGGIWGKNRLLNEQAISDVFVDGIRERIVEKICAFHKCEPNDIASISIMNKGYTNVMFKYSVFELPYVFRFPGVKSEILSNRKTEVIAQKLASDNHIDDACVYIDEDGCRISKFIEIEDISDRYLKDDGFMKELIVTIKKYHVVGKHISNIGHTFNPMNKADELLRFASERKGNLFITFGELRKRMNTIYEWLERDGIEKTMCHNDVYDKNILYYNENLDLIDWEFAGVGDPAFDLARILLFFKPDDKTIDKYLEYYFERKSSDIERLHWVAYICIHCWYYFAWALYRESMNETTDEWMIILYKKMIEIEAYVKPLYLKIYNDVYTDLST